MAYLLDADVFIQAKNLHYGFDFCPAFWDWIDQSHQAGRVFSIEKVGGELVAGADQLSNWAKSRINNGFFIQPDASVVPSLQTTSQWATSGVCEQAGVNIFLQAADYYLVAQALSYGYTVVTHEVVSASPKKVKIPNACLALSVKYITPYEMLRSEGARFVLP